MVFPSLYFLLFNFNNFVIFGDMMSSRIYIQVPSKVITDIRYLLKMKKPTFPCNEDYLFYIVSKIVQIPQYNAKLRNLRKVPLYSLILRYELGKNYKKYLDYLLEHKVIETDNHYVVSTPEKEGKCKCYGLRNKYLSCTLTEHEITKKSLLKQILKWKEKVFSEHENDELLSKLYGMMDGFTIDIDGATDTLDEMLDKKEINQRQHDIEINKCNKINNKENTSLSLFITKDSYNRVHTNFTNISKIVRENYLYHDGYKVNGVDIVSSQASLLCSMFSEYANSIRNVVENPLEIQHIPENYDIREKYVNKLNSIVGKKMFNDINRSLNYFNLTPEVMLNKIDAEIAKYIEAMHTDGIYEFFQLKYSELFGIHKDRKDVKKKWISYVFGKSFSKQPALEESKQMYSIWNSEFPILNNTLNHFKSNDYKTLAHSLQRREAELMFTKVCPAIDTELGIQYCTVHDSILVEDRYCSDVAKIFDRILKDNNILTHVKF